jgi:hypothetical protein
VDFICVVVLGVGGGGGKRGGKGREVPMMNIPRVQKSILKES